MFWDRSQLRRWAARMLVLWVLGVVTGVAHACLAPNLAGLSSRSTGVVAVDSKPGAVVPDEVHHGSHQKQISLDGLFAHHDGAGKSSCQDFCEKSSISIPPLKTALDDLQGQALPPSASAMAVAPPAVLPDELLLPRRDGGLAPPITIAFLRLAL